MLHYIFALVVLMHGLIHLMGITHELKLADREDPTTDYIVNFKGVKTVINVLWAVPYLLFLAAMILFMLYSNTWWMFATAGVFVSQILIILEWNEAKYGTIANIIILLAIIAAYGTPGFISM